MAIKKQRLEFPGEPLVVSPQFYTLKDDKFGRDITKRVNGRFKGTYAEIPSRAIVKGDYVQHSNAYTGPAIFSVAQDLGVRTMRPEEAQILFKQGRIPNQGSTYQDTALALNFSGLNHDMAMDLYQRLPQELRSLDKMPGVLIDLELERADIQPGVRYLFTANSELRTTPIINTSEGAFDENDHELTRTGFPSKTGSGNRKLYTNGKHNITLDNLGLVRVCLVRDGSVVAWNDYLQSSIPDGRVVLVKYTGGVAKK